MKSPGANFVNFNLATDPVEYREGNGNTLQSILVSENAKGKGEPSGLYFMGSQRVIHD